MSRPSTGPQLQALWSGCGIDPFFIGLIFISHGACSHTGVSLSSHLPLCLLSFFPVYHISLILCLFVFVVHGNSRSSGPAAAGHYLINLISVSTVSPHDHSSSSDHPRSLPVLQFSCFSFVLSQISPLLSACQPTTESFSLLSPKGLLSPPLSIHFFSPSFHPLKLNLVLKLLKHPPESVLHFTHFLTWNFSPHFLKKKKHFERCLRP